MAHNRVAMAGLFGDSTNKNLLRVKWAAGLVLLMLVTGGPARAADSAASRAAIHGTVSAGISARRAKPLPVFKNRAFCGPAVPDETLLIGAGGGLKNAAVLLRPIGKVSIEPRPLVLDNQRCAFVPHVQIAVVGGELRLKNSDPILHTVHARMADETLFNVGLPKWREVAMRLDRAGVIRITCDVLHTWMSAAILVTESPYFALTDAAGGFKLEGLPLGEYEMEVWHERLGWRRQRLSLMREAPVSLDVVYGMDQVGR
jgi:hypothetical protein